MKANLLNISTDLLTHIAFYLNLKDILELAECHTILQSVVYECPEIWTPDLLFPKNDSSITDSFIRQTVPRITRLYGLTKLTMINLPLTWVGYLLIFDQFAHTVKDLQIEAKSDTLVELNQHLCTFAGNLLLLQQASQMPISFRQYTFDDEQEYANALSESHLLSQGIDNLYLKHFKHDRLDDPPFEQLERFTIKLSSTSDHICKEEPKVIEQLSILFTFLSNSTDRDKIENEETVSEMSKSASHPIPAIRERTLKRPREETLPPITSFDIKCSKFDTILQPF